jgi:hypothetical protein
MCCSSGVPQTAPLRVGRGIWGLAEWHPRLKKRPDAQSPADKGDAEKGLI